MSLFVLPNELLHEIIDHLGVKDLGACTRVSLILKDIAGPRYMTALKFSPVRRFWASVDEKNCEALLVWRRMTNFTCPSNIYCSLFNAKDSHLRALGIFFESPQCANIPTAYLSCFGGTESLAATATLLASIRASGCQSLSYSARSDPSAPCVTSFPKSSRATPTQFESFSSACNNVFSSPLLSFTLTTLRNSPLRELVLQDTGLSPTMWARLLRSLDLPLLLRLEVDPQCSVRTLLTFLQRHSHIQSLCISVYGESKKARQSRPLPVHLPSLRALGGPSEYLKSLLQCLGQPSSVTALSVDLSNIKPGVPQISKVLDCAQHLPHLRDISISFHRNSSVVVPVTGLRVPKHEARTCGAIRLKISAAFDTVTDGQEEIVVCTVHTDVGHELIYFHRKSVHHG